VVGLLLDDVEVVVVLLLLIFFVGRKSSMGEGLPRLVLAKEGGPPAGGVLPGEEVVPEMAILVHALTPHFLGELVDVVAHLCFKLQCSLRWWRDRHLRTIELPAVGEGD
jgi:hypothetical protein